MQKKNISIFYKGQDLVSVFIGLHFGHATPIKVFYGNLSESDKISNSVKRYQGCPLLRFKKIRVFDGSIVRLKRSNIEFFLQWHNFFVCNMEDYNNLPRLYAGTGKSTRVSKICSPRRGLPSRGRCKSLTRGCISLSLYKVVVDYFSPTALNPHNKTPPFAFKIYFKTLSA